MAPRGDCGVLPAEEPSKRADGCGLLTFHPSHALAWALGPAQGLFAPYTIGVSERGLVALAASARSLLRLRGSRRALPTTSGSRFGIRSEAGGARDGEGVRCARLHGDTEPAEAEGEARGVREAGGMGM
jgi:hypothetical protein